MLNSYKYKYKTKWYTKTWISKAFVSMRHVDLHINLFKQISINQVKMNYLETKYKNEFN